jgi:hypothetical protein
MSENTLTVQGVTVAELILLLREQPQDAVIELEGCDCLGVMGSLCYDAPRHRVLLERTQEEEEL